MVDVLLKRVQEPLVYTVKFRSPYVSDAREDVAPGLCLESSEERGLGVWPQTKLLEELLVDGFLFAVEISLLSGGGDTLLSGGGGLLELLVVPLDIEFNLLSDGCEDIGRSVDREVVCEGGDGGASVSGVGAAAR